MSNGDFRKFYYTKVALGENCGCAERVIDLHEMDRTLINGRPLGSSDPDNAALPPPSRARVMWLRLTCRGAHADALLAEDAPASQVDPAHHGA